jgi:two-component system chemotaxis sensor kinase CheA
MAVDMTEVRQLFFEESFENLDMMESNLLDLQIGAVDQELVNSIFRAAHSIKGGAGIFKFEQVVHFAHITETLLDEIRKGEHLVTQPIIDGLLRAVDVMRMMLTALQENTDYQVQEVMACQTLLNSFLKTSKFEEEASIDTAPKPTPLPGPVALPLGHPAVPEQLSPLTTEPVVGVAGWRIVFKPLMTMLKTGNDPINLFRELVNLGALEVKVDTSQIPSFADLDPQACYLSWELILHAAVELATIEEIFDWVEGDCDLQITPLQTPVSKAEVAKLTVTEMAAPGLATPSDPVAQPESPTAKEEITVSAVPITPIDLDQSAIEPAASETPSTAVVCPQPGQPTAPAMPLATATVTTTDLLSKSQVAATTLELLPASDCLLHPRGPVNQATEASSIRVSIDKIDNLINLVGELVITQSMLDQVGENFDSSKLMQLRDGLSQLERNTHELQENVMRIRMLPISYSFNRFPRLVHDLSVQLGKKVELKLSGVHTELDKTVLEKMSDPLVHLVRNALDHGIELPEQRRQAGKPETGLLHLHAFHQGGNIIISISDDGAGFDLERIRTKAIAQGLLNKDDNIADEQLYELVFLPGFSTASQVSDLSGRGVGMDVVRRNIRSLGGTIEIKSKRGQGSTFSIRLPLTLAILDGQLVRVGQDIYILSLLSIIESLRVKPQLVNTLAGKAEVYKLRDEYLPILRLYELFDILPGTNQLDQGLLVVVEGDGQKIGLFVDELLSQQQIVIKSLESNFKQIQGISGATILGDGSVALILDIAGLIQVFHHQKKIPTLRSRSSLGVIL